MYATHEVFQISEALLNFLIKRTMQLTPVTVFLPYDYNMVSPYITATRQADK